VRSDVSNSWAWVEGALIDDDRGEAATFGLETAYYSGVEGGEAWSEGSQHASETLTAPPRSRYVLRADLQWDPARSSPPAVDLEIRRGGYSGGQFCFLLFVLLSPLLLLVHRRSFENRRWAESTEG
jgi:hypothetical protein